MKTAQLKFGNEIITLRIPEENLMRILEANSSANAPSDINDESAEIIRALHQPIGTQRLSELVRQGQKIVIMVSDITRPAPSDKMLPPLLEELFLSGVCHKDIKVIFGMGIHRRHTEAEKRRLVGDDVYDRITCIDSSEEQYIDLGESRFGTPLHICRSVVEADIRICTGNIEYHYFAGYSGGAKAIMPGAANDDSIRHNHKLQLNEKAVSGILNGNPVREDIDEIGEILGITFILNVVLNEKKQVARGFAGHYLEAHRTGCIYLDSLYRVSVPEYADIVVVSAGGFPKDINMYQAQKALDNASQAVKPGGIIILVGECREGFGEKTFEKWIREADNPNTLINRLKEEFVLGGHKAAAIGKVVRKATVFFVSAMPPDDVKKLFFVPCETAQHALDQAIVRLGDDARVLVMPQGGSILPCVTGESSQ